MDIDSWYSFFILIICIKTPADLYLFKVNNTKVWNLFKVNNKNTKRTTAKFNKQEILLYLTI